MNGPALLSLSHELAGQARQWVVSRNNGTRPRHGDAQAIVPAARDHEFYEDSCLDGLVVARMDASLHARSYRWMRPLATPRGADMTVGAALPMCCHCRGGDSST